jgi:hypothetical protein
LPQRSSDKRRKVFGVPIMMTRLAFFETDRRQGKRIDPVEHARRCRINFGGCQDLAMRRQRCAMSAIVAASVCTLCAIIDGERAC